MFYPLGGCETQPLITVANITLRNVQQYGNILPPGIIRCNETHKCHGFEFDNVNESGLWRWLGIGYITEDVYGKALNSHPRPSFISDDDEDEEYEDAERQNMIVELIRLAWFHFTNFANDVDDLVDNQPSMFNFNLPTQMRELVGGVQTSYKSFIGAN